MVYVNRRKVLIMFKMLKSRLHVGREFPKQKYEFRFLLLRIYFQTYLSIYVYIQCQKYVQSRIGTKCRLEVLFLKHLFVVASSSPLDQLRKRKFQFNDQKNTLKSESRFSRVFQSQHFNPTDKKKEFRVIFSQTSFLPLLVLLLLQRQQLK